MGVKDLWTILSPTCERKSLYELQGKAVAVDLSCWVVEDQSVATYSTQPRMYLRNLFFRTTCLLMLNVKPVFVLEGDAPTMKLDTMARRKDAQQKSHLKHHGPSQTQPTQSQNVARKGTRTRLKSLLKQCEAMLRVMGVSCVQGAGEAEALCAQLNAAGLVDGCITQDGDCFLYGAHKVYRNFTISTAGSSSSSGFSVDVFHLERVERHLSLGRRKLVALALLLGCDYFPGVPGVGKVAALAFLDSVSEEEVLDRMLGWRTNPHLDRLEKNPSGLAFMTPEKRKMITTELNVRKKAMEVPEFPAQEVMAEFLDERPPPKELDLDWRAPSLQQFVPLSVKQLAWTETYAVEKFFPLVARWQVAHLAAKREEVNFPFSPTNIVKKRVLRGIACYELNWADHTNFLQSLTLDEDKTAEDLLVSVEPQTLVDQAFPHLVSIFQASLQAKKLAKKKSTQKGKENVKSQTKIDAFLKPNEFPRDEADSLVCGKLGVAKQRPKKPQVTIASLMRQMAAIERCKVARSPLRLANKAAAARKSTGFHLQGEFIPRDQGCAKRLASPRLPVGLKTRKMSTPGKRVSMRKLEESFRNVSIIDYSEDDGEFSDISAIIDGIVGTSPGECEARSRKLEYLLDENDDEKKHSTKVEFCEPATKFSKEIDLHGVKVGSDDEFDFCNLEIVPLHIKLGSQL